MFQKNLDLVNFINAQFFIFPGKQTHILSDLIPGKKSKSVTVNVGSITHEKKLFLMNADS